MPSNNINDHNLTQLYKKIGQTLSLSSFDKAIDATAWFLGPKAENGQALLDFVQCIVEDQIHTRKTFAPKDPTIYDVKSDDAEHKKSIALINDQLKELLKQLKASIPLASYRNQSHMYWDITLPGAIGYFAGMLYNQNNVAAEASPVTTLLEIEVGKSLSQMLGFNINPDNQSHPVAWGHITCDGSVANGESMWAARNLKFLPVAMMAAIINEPELAAAKMISVENCKRQRSHLINMPTWELLNLPVDEVIGLLSRVEKDSGIDQAIIRHAIDQYSVQNIGLAQFQQRHLDSYEQATPLVMVPATAHYSWPKTAALLGLGTCAVKLIEVDLDGRMQMPALRRELDRCLQTGRPVIQVVAVLGSTEEGAIDPLADIVKIRREYQQLGLNFVIHVDAAWGGYFKSILCSGMIGSDPAACIDGKPQLYLSEHFRKHYAALPEADSVTLDPHKSGFIPYPAGSLCYRNGAMRDLIAYMAPVVYHGGVDVTVGPYGIEGSKPGAAACSVYLSHKVIPLTKDGYGRMLGRCLFNSKRFYAALVTMDLVEDCPFLITPFQRLPAEKQGATPHEIHEQKNFMHDHFVKCSTDELVNRLTTEDPQPALALFQAIGSDLSIVSYAFNFKTAKGINRDLNLMNELNDNIFRELSLKPTESGELPSAEMFVTASAFDPAAYGTTLVNDFASRAGVEPAENTAIKFLISTSQNPWLSSTSTNENMIDKLIEVLRKTVIRARQQILDKYELE